jgi:hypothetical protein
MKENKRHNTVYTTNVTSAILTTRPPDMPTRFAGSWNVDRVSLSLENKPNWLHRKATTLLLGWIWKDN